MSLIDLEAMMENTEDIKDILNEIESHLSDIKDFTNWIMYLFICVGWGCLIAAIFEWLAK